MDTQVIVKGMDGKMYKQLQPEEAVLMCLDVPLYVRYLQSHPHPRISRRFESWHITPEKARTVPGVARERVARWEYECGTPYDGTAYDGYFYVRFDDSDKPEYVPYE